MTHLRGERVLLRPFGAQELGRMAEVRKHEAASVTYGVTRATGRT